MTTKYELVSYLSGLISIMDSMDDAGAKLRSQTLGREYERVYQQLKDTIEKEENDAKQSEERGRINQTGTDRTRSEPRSGEPTRSPR